MRQEQEPIPWDRKESFSRERRRHHQRSESLGSVPRWRDSSAHHHHPGNREFNRPDFRRLSGHGKQGGWHLFPEESGHGHVFSRSCDKMLEVDSRRPSVSRGDGKYDKRNKESRGSFSQRDWRGHSWEPTNGSMNFSRRQFNTNSNRSSVDDMLTYSSHPPSDFVNTWEQHHMEDHQHDKMDDVNGLGAGQICDRNSSLHTIGWKPLNWTRSVSSRGSGFSHSNRSRSIGVTNSRGIYEGKAGLQHKNATAVQSNSGEAATCETSSAPSEETNSRKKPRLNWGEGLAKFEGKKVEGPDISITANNDGLVSSPFNMEPSNFLSLSLVDKSPKVSGFSDCASPATPSSVACSPSPGADDNFFGKAANVDSDISKLISSPGPGSQNHLQMLPFNLEKVDIDPLAGLGSSIIELLQSDDPISVDSSILRSTAINKLLILKADISKVLEVTETEIDSLENELKSLKSESRDRFPCSAGVGSLLVCYNAKSCGEHIGGSDKVAHPEPLQIVSSDDLNVEKMPLSTNLLDIHDNCKEGDIDNPGAAISKFVEPLPLINAVSSCDVGRYGTCSEDLDQIQSTAVKYLIPCTYRQAPSVSTCGNGISSMEVKDGMDAKSSASFYSSTEDILYNTIISCNKECAKAACEVFAKLLPEECGKIGNIGASSDSCSNNGALVMEKFAKKKRFARFKERVITLKFKALRHLWKEDMRLLSIRKYRPKSQKKLELGLRTISNSHQKKRSILFPSPVGNQLRLVPTSEMINYTSQLLSESQNEIHRSNLKMPALILDEKEKMISKFLSGNGLVEDPLAIEKERAMINPWTSEEREIFLEKFAAFGKDFRKIASFLNHKTTADCVEFYYKNHKSDVFEKIKKKDGGKLGKFFKAKTDLIASGKKWNGELNAASLEILSAASVMADDIAGNRKRGSESSLWRRGYGSVTTSRGADSITERSSSFDILRDERVTVAADVLAGICGSLSSEAMSSCITSSVDPVEGNRDGKLLKVRSVRKQPVTPDITQNIDDETCSDESCGEMDSTDWTDAEKAAFLQAVSSFGNDFAMIAQCVRTKSRDQCKVFFSKARKCLRLNPMRPGPENIGSLVNDDADGGRSDTDDAGVVETGSVIGTDTSGTKTDEDQPSSDMNTYHDESNPAEARNLSADLDDSKEINGEVDHEDVNMVSNACIIGGESKLGTDDNGVVLYSSDKSGSLGDQRAIIMSDSIEIGKEKPNEVGGAVTELVSASEIIEPCHSNSVAEDRLVSEVSSGHRGNELEGSPTCLVDKDDKDADTDGVVELKGKVHDSSTTVNTSLPSVGISCSRLSFHSENQPQLCLEKPHISESLEDPLTNANSVLQNTDGTAVQCKKTANQDLPSSTCDFQGSRDLSGHNSSSNHGYQLHSPGNLSDHVEAGKTPQCYPLHVPVKKEANANMSCSSSTTELPLLSQKIEQHDDDCSKTQLRCSIDSENTSRNGDVKLFGKILTSPLSTEKPNLSAKGDEENGPHHLKLSSASSSLNLTGHRNAGGKSAILKFDHIDSQDLVDVPIMCYWDGNQIPSGFSSLPDSAAYPAAFSNYPTSAKLEQQSSQVSAKNSEQPLNGASAVTTREAVGSNGVIDCQMLGNGDVLKVQQPFMGGEVNRRQDVLSEMQRRDGFEAISSLQQQDKGMNGVGKPGIQSQSVVSDPVAAIKMHHSNADQTGSVIIREDEPSWAGEGELGR